MNELSANQRKQIEALTKEYAATLKTHPTKGKYNFKQNSAGFAFAAVEDIGNEAFSFLNDERDSFPELDAVQKVRRVVENHRAVEDAKAYAERKNAVIRRNRERKALEK